MESEFREKLNVHEENRPPADAGQPVPSVTGQTVQNTGDSLEDFDNQKLQEQLNMQIQSNQAHLQFSQQPPRLSQQQALNVQNLSQQTAQPSSQALSQPQVLQQPLNPQLFNQINQKFVQQAQNQPPSNEDNPSPTSNRMASPLPQQSAGQQEAKPIHNVPLADNQVARIQSPIANFDPSAYLPSWCKKDLFNRVAENAVNGFNSVLITLDPQMKELLKEGGPSILVTSTHPFDVASIRDGFLDVFKRATVKSKSKPRFLIAETNR